MNFRLSTRESQILREVINGRTNHIIANKLYISNATVKAHVSTLIQKLKVDNRVQLAVAGVCMLMDQINFDE